MPPAFHFLRISLPGHTLYQVRQDSPLNGSVSEIEGGWQASVVVAGKLFTQPFLDRGRAAAWLLSIAPRMKR